MRAGGLRIGPLGCLALLGAGTIGWSIGRLPDLLRGMDSDIASAEIRLPVLAAVLRATAKVPALVEAEIAAVVPPVELPPRAAQQPRHAGERQHPPQPNLRPVELATVMGAGVAPPDDGDETKPFPFELATYESFALVPEPAAIATPAPPAATYRPVAATNAGFALATSAYASFGTGDRRGAAEGFAAALAADPRAGNATAWKRALRQLTRRWSGEDYVIMRGDGSASTLGTTPVLGGGQGGRSFAYTASPLARRPLYAVIRTTGGRTKGLRFDGEADSEQAALGLRWRPDPGATLSIERLFGVTAGGRSAWTVRVAGGRTRRIGGLVADAYAEAGIVGKRRRDLIAGVQARIFQTTEIRGLRFESGLGLWSGLQRAGTMVDRADLGPTLSVVLDPMHLRASLDYRFRVAGNASPGSGPALTVSRSF